MQNTRVTVEVAGMPIHLRGTEEEAYIKSVAAYVNEKATALQKSYPSLSTSNCVALSALNIADELFKLRLQYAELDRRIEELRLLSAEQSQTSPARRGAKGPMKRPFEEKEKTESFSQKI